MEAIEVAVLIELGAEWINLTSSSNVIARAEDTESHVWARGGIASDNGHHVGVVPNTNT